jgi:hypothetical protein
MPTTQLDRLLPQDGGLQAFRRDVIEALPGAVEEMAIKEARTFLETCARLHGFPPP